MRKQIGQQRMTTKSEICCILASRGNRIFVGDGVNLFVDDCDRSCDVVSQEEQEAADLPRRHFGKELLAKLEERFRGEKVTSLEESLTEYNNWKISPDKESLMVAVDRLKSLFID